MTVASSTDRATFLGNGTTTVFSLPFRFFTNSEIQAFLVTNATGALTALTLGTHYTLVGAGLPEVNGNAASVLTMITAPTSLQSLFVQRVIPVTQATDIVNQGRFFPEIHEDVFDRLTMLIQQNSAGIKGAIRVPDTDPEPARLPTVTARIDKLLSFDAAGNPVAIAAVNQSATDLELRLANSSDTTKGAALVGFLQAGAGAVGRTLLSKVREKVSVKDFGAIGDGVVDDTAAIQLAINSGALIVEFDNSTYLLNSNVAFAHTFSAELRFHGTKIILGSNTAGFTLRGPRQRITGRSFITQSSQSFTPTAIKITNDATFPNSSECTISGVWTTSVYISLHATMPNTGPSDSCYRHTIIDCNFSNFYLQKTWSGSRGIKLDGPGAGNAAGNDTKIIGSLVKGYQANYEVTNSIVTQIVACSGDGAANNILYSGTSSGLQVIGGYYEFNDVFIAASGQHDLYLLHPSTANTTTFQTGAVTFIKGGVVTGVSGAGSPIIGIGSYVDDIPAGIAEIYAVNGIKEFSGLSKTLREQTNTAGVKTRFFDLNMSTGTRILVDTIANFTGGSTPLNIQTGGAVALTLGTNAVDKVVLDHTSGNFRPFNDNSQKLGIASNRWSEVFAGTGTINTSDAREKTTVRVLTAPELAAASQLSKEIGVYRWLSSVAVKGDGSREHIGMTVQQAIAVMKSHGLDPFGYGFICYDQWAEEWRDIPAVTLLQDSGEVDAQGAPVMHEVEIEPACREKVRDAGDRYSFRPDELLLFIAAGLEARLSSIEAASLKLV